MADTLDSKSSAERCVGSSPTSSTRYSLVHTVSSFFCFFSGLTVSLYDSVCCSVEGLYEKQSDKDD